MGVSTQRLVSQLYYYSLWFLSAYTIAKYGMSMCVLGMAEEFRGEIAVNALWPKTGLYLKEIP